MVAQFSSLHAEDRQQRFGLRFIEEQMNTFLILIILLPLFFFKYFQGTTSQQRFRFRVEIHDWSRHGIVQIEL